MYRIKYKQLLELAKDPASRRNLINLYFFKLDLLGITNSINISNKTKCLQEDMNFLSLYADLINIFEYYSNIDYDTSGYLENILTIDNLLDIVHDFFKDTDQEIYNTFLKHFNKRNDHLQISKKKLFSSFDGEAYLNPPTEDYFITLKKDNTLLFAQNYAHECGHIIGNIIGDNDLIHYNPLFIEIDSYFFELLFLDYLCNFKKFQNDANYLKNDLLSITNQDANNIILTNDLVNNTVDLIQSGLFNSNRQIFRELALSSRSNKDEINDLLSVPVQYSFKYLFSQTYSFSLFDLYKKDKEKALYLFKQMCLDKNLDTYAKIEAYKKLGVCPASNIDSFTRSLKR